MMATLLMALVVIGLVGLYDEVRAHAAPRWQAQPGRPDLRPLRLVLVAQQGTPRPGEGTHAGVSGRAGS